MTLYDPNVNRERQEQTIMAALVSGHDALATRNADRAKLDGLAGKHRALLYLQGQQYDALRDALKSVPEPFRPAVAAFDARLEELQKETATLFADKQQLKTRAAAPATIDLLVNQHKDGVNLYLPVMVTERETGLMRTVYEHGKAELTRYQTKLVIEDVRFFDYLLLAGNKQVNLSGLKERIERVPEELKEASLKLRLVDEFRFQPAIGQPAPPKPAQAPYNGYAGNSKFDRDVRDCIYGMRDKGVLSEDIAKHVRQKFNLEMSKCTVMAVLAWRSRPVKKAPRK